MPIGGNKKWDIVDEDPFPEPEPGPKEPFEFLSISELKKIMDLTRNSKDPEERKTFKRAEDVFNRHGKSSGAHTLTTRRVFNE